MFFEIGTVSRRPRARRSSPSCSASGRRSAPPSLLCAFGLWLLRSPRRARRAARRRRARSSAPASRPRRLPTDPAAAAGASRCPIPARRPAPARAMMGACVARPRPLLPGRAEPRPPLRRLVRHRRARRPASTAGRAARPSRRSAGNVEFFPTAAAAQQRGYRACKRCRPDATPGSPEWNVRGDVVARAMRLVVDGVVDREGVARPRPPARLQRAPPDAARHRRARRRPARHRPGPARPHRRASSSRRPTWTSRPIAFAAGFGSVRQFNDTVRDVFAATPSALRAAGRPRPGRRRPAPSSSTSPSREPFDAERPRGVPRRPRRARRRGLGRRGVPPRARPARTATASPSLRRRRRGRDRRPASRCACGSPTGATSAPPCGASAGCSTSTPTPSPSTPRSADDPVLAPLVAAVPGLRVPGQRRPVRDRRAGRRRPADLRRRRAHRRRAHRRRGRRAAGDRRRPGDPRVPVAGRARRRSTRRRCRCRAAAAARSSSWPPASPTGASCSTPAPTATTWPPRCSTVPGIGPWTAGYVLMRGLGDPDVFLPTDLGVRAGLARLGARRRSGRALATVALVRPAPPVGDRRRRHRREEAAMTRCHHTIDSPIGPLTLVAADGALREIRFPNAPPVDADAGPDDPTDPVLVDAARQLGEYFAGHPARRSTCRCEPLGTPFQLDRVAGPDDDPVRRDGQLRRAGPPARPRRQGPGRRRGERSQPAPDRAAVPPRRRQRRQPRRLRRRHRDEGLAAAPRAPGDRRRAPAVVGPDANVRSRGAAGGRRHAGVPRGDVPAGRSLRGDDARRGSARGADHRRRAGGRRHVRPDHRSARQRGRGRPR